MRNADFPMQSRIRKQRQYLLPNITLPSFLDSQFSRLETPHLKTSNNNKFSLYQKIKNLFIGRQQQMEIQNYLLIWGSLQMDFFLMVGEIIKIQIIYIILLSVERSEMSNYKELIENILAPYHETKIEALRKLIYLAVNDQNKFSQHVSKISERLPHFFIETEDEQVKLLSLQLLSEMATNFTAKIPAEYYNFPLLVALLSDENPEVRKSAHYLILIFIKKYEHLDEVIDGYLEKLQKSPDHWKTVQKIIHSFQSLLVIEPKCVTYGQNYSKLDDFLGFLLKNRTHSHSLVQKASEQTVSSFVKNQHVPEILPKLDHKIIQELIDHASRLNINLPVTGNLKNKPFMMHKDEDDDIEEIKISRKRNLSLLEQLMSKLDEENDWKIKSETIQSINNELAKGNAEFPEELIEKVLDLTYDYNFKTCITAMNGLVNLVTLYPGKIAGRHRQIEDVVIDKICDLKMAVRQLANKILRKIYPNHSKDFLKRLLSKLSHCSVVGKEEILNFLQEVFTTNIPTELNFLLTEVSNQLLNENTRIKIKAIDCLVKISIANNLDECKLILSKKLNKVYYDMFLERLKEKLGNDRGNQKWEDHPTLNKAMTWQADRPHVAGQSDKQAQTKMEFGNRKKFNDTEDDFAQFGGKIQRDTNNINSISGNSKKTTHTGNTFDTFKSFEGEKHKNPKKSTEAPSFIGYDELETENHEEKRIPLKPNPVKKKNPSIDAKEVKEVNPLVIQSREYMSKNSMNFDEPKEEKIEKQKSKLKSKVKQAEESSIRKQKTSTEPFSIKKSGSRKQHALDYKATQYISKDELAPIQNTKESLKIIITNLPKDNEWSKQFDSLDTLRRLIKNHPEFYPTITQNMQAIMPEVLKLVESLRSSVAKNAMMTLAQMCQAFKKSMDAYLEPIFIKLFRKAQDANSFIVEEVRKCVVSLCVYCSTSKIIGIIMNNANAKPIPVRLKVALCIDKILEKHNYNSTLLKENPKLVGVMSNLVVDGSSEVRSYAKEIFLEIASQNPIPQVESMFKKGSSKDSWQRWNHILDRQLAHERRKKF